MTQVHGNAATNTSEPADRTSLGRLIGVGLILVSLVLLAVGAYRGPYSYATSTPGKLTVDTCTVSIRYGTTTSHKTRTRTKTRWCYGTFTSNDGTTKDLNAELQSKHLYQRGTVIQARRISDLSYSQDLGWVNAIAVGCMWWFGALLPLAVGIFGAVTGFVYRRAGNGLFRTSFVLIAVGVIGWVVSLLVTFFT
jgi:hypothetical protein